MACSLVGTLPVLCLVCSVCMQQLRLHPQPAQGHSLLKREQTARNDRCLYTQTTQQMLHAVQRVANISSESLVRDAAPPCAHKTPCAAHSMETLQREGSSTPDTLRSPPLLQPYAYTA